MCRCNSPAVILDGILRQGENPPTHEATCVTEAHTSLLDISYSLPGAMTPCRRPKASLTLDDLSRRIISRPGSCMEAAITAEAAQVSTGTGVECHDLDACSHGLWCLLSIQLQLSTRCYTHGPGPGLASEDECAPPKVHASTGSITFLSDQFNHRIPVPFFHQLTSLCHRGVLDSYISAQEQHPYW